MKRTIQILAVLLALGCGGDATTTTTEETATTSGDEASRPAPVEVETGSLEAAIAGAHRSEDNRARDAHRHPRETLEFFGLEPSMTVVEMAPGGGWYTEILAPVLRDHGTLVAAIADPEESQYSQRWIAHVEEHPEVYDQVQRQVFELPESPSLGAPNSADMVVTFRSTHGWINGDRAAEVFQAIFDVLKPGGVLGLVQHRAAEGADVSETSPQGYVPEATVIEIATNAGFVLEERSEINANPNDDHEHPEGVWTLPPSLRLGDTDREQWAAIGESDRMTLRFRKPAGEGDSAVPDEAIE